MYLSYITAFWFIFDYILLIFVISISIGVSNVEVSVAEPKEKFVLPSPLWEIQSLF